MSNERKPIGLISIVAYSTGDIELKFAGIKKEDLPGIFEQMSRLAKKNENQN